LGTIFLRAALGQPNAGLPDSFLAQHTKTGKNIPNNHKIYQMAEKYKK
jgi:hypothetical protein